MYKSFQRIDGVAVEISVSDERPNDIRLDAVDRFNQLIIWMDKTEARGLSRSLNDAAAEAGFTG